MSKKGETPIGTVYHHQQHSRRHLNRARVNLAFGDTQRAADAVRRSASHAVTAACVHWHYPHRSRRLLTNALISFIFDLRLATAHLDTFVDVYSVGPNWQRSVDHPDALRHLTLLRKRVANLATDLNDAIAADPNPPTLAQTIAAIQSQPAHGEPAEPTPA